MATPASESLRPILLAPLSIVLFYLAMAMLAFMQAPRMHGSWVFWMIGSIAVVAYAVATPAGMLLIRLYRGVGGPPASACIATGVVCAVTAAVVADLPEPNLERIRYYLFAGFSGALWGISLYSLSKNERR